MRRWIKRFEDVLRHRFLYDAYVVSYPKCGRTWLNTILLHYVRRHYDGIEEPLPFEWAPPIVRHTWYRRFPNICFTHDIAGRAISYQELSDHFDPSNYLAKRTVVLVRDPRDVVVSYYHHAMKKTHKNRLSPDMSLSDFLRHEAYGIRSVVTFYNLWAPVIRRHPNVSVCRYEDLGAGTVPAVRVLLQFFEASHIDEDALEWAVRVNSFGNLQAREKRKLLRHSPGTDLAPGVLRVRKGKVGGYEDEMLRADIDHATRLVAEQLAPIYAYQGA